MPRTFRTEYYAEISRTDAVGLAIEGHAYLLSAGLSEAIPQIGWDSSAIVGYIQGLPQGVITFGHTKWAKQLDISVGYVREEARGRGLYRAMWNALVAQARVLGVPVIMGNTDMSNDFMRAVARKLGRTEIGVILKFDVPQE